MDGITGISVLPTELEEPVWIFSTSLLASVTTFETSSIGIEEPDPSEIDTDPFFETDPSTTGSVGFGVSMRSCVYMKIEGDF